MALPICIAVTLGLGALAVYLLRGEIFREGSE
jgi:hypothetical protein